MATTMEGVDTKALDAYINRLKSTTSISAGDLTPSKIIASAISSGEQVLRSYYPKSFMGDFTDKQKLAANSFAGSNQTGALTDTQLDFIVNRANDYKGLVYSPAGNPMPPLGGREVPTNVSWSVRGGARPPGFENYAPPFPGNSQATAQKTTQATAQTTAQAAAPTQASINAARNLFQTYATGFAPDAEAINFWANKIDTQGAESAFNEFINPPQGASAPRFAAMQSDPDYLAAVGQGTGAGSNFLSGGVRESTQIDDTTGATLPTAADWFRLYATNFTPDQTALDFWNNKIATLGYDRALNEFFNPSDINAPRNQAMFADPDYIAAGGNGRFPTTPGTPGGTPFVPGTTTPPLTPSGTATYGGFNFFATPLQPGFYSERGFETGQVPFGTFAAQPGMDAQSLFQTYATDFTPDTTALDFWNNKIATLGYRGALNEFINPSDINAPRNQVMFADPEYQAAVSGAGPMVPFTPPQAMFRSGVSGFTPLTPTGFEFGVAPVTAPRYTFTPGVFNPGFYSGEGEWSPTPFQEAQGDTPGFVPE